MSADPLGDVLFEWNRGPYRLSTEDSLVVMARLFTLEAENAELRDFIGEPCTLEDLKASIDRHRAELAAVGDPNRTSVFEYMRDADGTVTACRTVTTSAWRPL